MVNSVIGQSHGIPLADVVERIEREVRADIETGIVPATVGNYSELHDYVDANEYGGACEAWYEGCCGSDEFCRFWGAAQKSADRWLRSGRPG